MAHLICGEHCWEIGVHVVHPSSAIRVKDCLGSKECNHIATYSRNLCARLLRIDELSNPATISNALRAAMFPFFAIIHSNWLSIPYLFGLGLVLGILRQRSGSLLPGMVVHMIHNSWIVLFEHFSNRI